LSRVGEGAVAPAQVDLDVNDGTDYKRLRRGVSAWVNRVLIARTLARSVPRQRSRSEEEVAV